MQGSIAGGGLNAQSMMGGLQSLQGMFNLGLSPYAAQWMPMQQMQGLLGQNMMEGTSQSDAMNFSLTGGK
jgi:hypothetical protein